MSPERVLYGFALCLLTLTAGCESGSSTSSVPTPAPSNPAPSPATAVPGTGQSPAVSATSAPQKAAAGVAKQGRSLDNESTVGRIIAQPVISLFAFKENAVFKIQIPSALKLFEASEGRKPKSHQEFMDKIITANQIRLPELQAGSEYNFHTDTGELWVHPVEAKK